MAIPKAMEDGLRRAFDTLRAGRLVLTERLLSTPDNELQSVAQELANNRATVMDGPLRLAAKSAEDQHIYQSICEKLSAGFGSPGSLQALLAGMLYDYPLRLPVPCDLPAVPAWLRNDYTKFMLSAPAMFVQRGDAERHVEHTSRWLGYLATEVERQRDSETWRSVGLDAISNLNCIPLYFSEANLREVMTQRGRLMTVVLESLGHKTSYTPPPRTHQRVRLGIVLKVWTDHTETYLALSLFEHLDRNRYEIILYAQGESRTSFEAYCRSRCDRFSVLPNEVAGQVAALRSDALDALVFATNVSCVSNVPTFLGCFRVAPIQIVYGGSPVTSGLPCCDYFVSPDEHCEPQEGVQAHYSESRVLLPCSPGFRLPDTSGPVQVIGDRTALGIPHDSIVFFSGANFFKIGPALRECWVRILAAVPNSVLLLAPYGPAWSSKYPAAVFETTLRDQLRAVGVEPDRLMISSVKGRANVCEVIKATDVYLDSFPYVGSVSILDPVQMGVPTVVFEGTIYRSRSASHLMHILNLSQFIVHSEDDYCNLSVRLGTDQAFRAECRRIFNAGKEHMFERLQSTKQFSSSFDQWLTGQLQQRTATSR